MWWRSVVTRGCRDRRGGGVVVLGCRDSSVGALRFGGVAIGGRRVVPARWRDARCGCDMSRYVGVGLLSRVWHTCVGRWRYVAICRDRSEFGGGCWVGCCPVSHVCAGGVTHICALSVSRGRDMHGDVTRVCCRDVCSEALSRDPDTRVVPPRVTRVCRSHDMRVEPCSVTSVTCPVILTHVWCLSHACCCCDMRVVML